MRLLVAATLWTLGVFWTASALAQPPVPIARDAPAHGPAESAPPAPAEQAPATTFEQAPTVALHRLELRPFVGWAFWHDSLTSAFAGGDVGFRVARTWAVQIDAALYAPFNKGEGANPTWPLNESQFSSSLDLVFFPLANVPGWGAAAEGKEAGTLEPFVSGGLGVLRTRPVAVVDPVHRDYDWNTMFSLDAALGVRVFFNRWLAGTLEIRDIIYYEKIESAAVAGGPAVPVGAQGYNVDSPTDPATWYDPDTRVTNVIQVRLGASFFLGE